MYITQKMQVRFSTCNSLSNQFTVGNGVNQRVYNDNLIIILKQWNVGYKIGNKF